MSTLYGILGISQSASGDDIRRAYKKKALETHPDRLGPSASEMRREMALSRFQKVNEAFNILGDKQKRKEYDATLLNSTTTLNRPVDPREDEEQLKRMRDRMEWALQQRKREEERREAKDKESKDAQEKKGKEEKMAKEFLQELFSLNPEWEERRRRVQQQRAQRPKFDVKRTGK